MSEDLTIEEKNKGGRPRVELTEAQLEELKILAPICTLQEVADYFGICQKTFERIKIRDEEVLSIYKKAKIQTKGIIGSSLIRRAIAGDTAAAIFYMKTQGRWRVPKDEEEDIKDKELKITVEIKEHENLDKLTPYQIQQLKDDGSL